jgi:hypothetical protein
MLVCQNQLVFSGTTYTEQYHTSHLGDELNLMAGLIQMLSI